MTKEEFFTRYTFNRDTDRLGAGSFGTVYRAYDTVLDCWVALKIAPASTDRMSLRKEVELVKALPQHPNVAGYEECFTFSDATGEVDIAVLRYYPEGSLANLLAVGSLSDDEMREIVSQIIAGIRFLHSHRVIHRDLKPSNILMARRPDGSPVAKIADFGISKTAGADDDTITTAATVSYASPEQLNGVTVGPAADIWSLGVIVYRMITGRLPFTADDADPNSMRGRARIIEKITSGHLPADIASLPYPWDRLIASCLVIDPALRLAYEPSLSTLLSSGVSQPLTPIPQSAMPPAVHPADLRPPVDSTDVEDTVLTPSPAPPSPTYFQKRNGWIITTIVIALLIMSGVLLALLTSNRFYHNPDSSPTMMMDSIEAPYSQSESSEWGIDSIAYEPDNGSAVWVDTTDVVIDTVDVVNGYVEDTVTPYHQSHPQSHHTTAADTTTANTIGGA